MSRMHCTFTQKDLSKITTTTSRSKYLWFVLLKPSIYDGLRLTRLWVTDQTLPKKMAKMFYITNTLA